MKIYISTVESLEFLSNPAGFVPDGSVSERVVVFYKDADTIAMNCVAKLYCANRKVDLVKVSDRDDMLINLGVMIGSMQSCAEELSDSIVLLDASIPVPTCYAGKVTAGYPVGARTTAKRRNTRRTSKKKDTVADDNAGKSDAVDANKQTESVSEVPGMNPPESDAAASDVSPADIKKN